MWYVTLDDRDGPDCGAWCSRGLKPITIMFVSIPSSLVGCKGKPLSGGSKSFVMRKLNKSRRHIRHTLRFTDWRFIDNNGKVVKRGKVGRKNNLPGNTATNEVGKGSRMDEAVKLELEQCVLDCFKK